MYLPDDLPLSALPDNRVTEGTKEWADSNENCVKNCEHDCRYCYAKKMALRYGRIKKPEEWGVMRVNEKKVSKGYRKREGRIMFPSSHDITPSVLGACVTVLTKLLEAGNSVLITTKPHLACVQRMCAEFEEYEAQVQFRFTITTRSDAKIRFWEPGAPSYPERVASIAYAFAAGFKTSVSVEPFLDKDPWALVSEIEPFVTESIWIGPMNYHSHQTYQAGTEEERRFDSYLQDAYEVNNLVTIYQTLKTHPLVRWKDGFARLLRDKLKKFPGGRPKCGQNTLTVTTHKIGEDFYTVKTCNNTKCNFHTNRE